MQTAAAERISSRTLQKMADPDGYVRLGPIPKGTPINLIANLEPDLVQAVKLATELAPGPARRRSGARQRSK